jgi:23S rRNA pseudouridine2604 synthase
MTPPTLKLPPRSGPAGPAKPPTSRQRRAQHGRAPSVALAPGHTLATPPAPPDAPPRRKKPATAPRGKTGPEPALRRPPASTREDAPPAANAAPRASLPKLVPENPRLSKRMSELGLCSRREADEWIENGWVKVNGVVTNTLGTRVAPEAEIEIDAAARRHQSEQVTFLLHKPIGYVSGQAEDGYQPASVLIRPENRWPEDRAPITFKPSQLRGLAPAGRLDIDSTGLIVFTQDGRVARRLIGRDSEVEKEYLVRVEGTLSPAGMKQLQHGLELDGVQLKPARVSWQNEHQLRFVLREGRKRQIRRMCELVGLAVTGLKRVRTGSVVLGKLPVGQWRYLRADEKF